ncbi:MAG TPA: hypothetical protein VH328_07935, partial [Burkholderiaceae bacterium]|nr:hypothetical protein [Burkholderiaceae bacterium]
MPIQVTALDHVNLRASHAMFERLRAFYRDVVGLEEGPRPNFGSEGTWLYAGGRPVLHLSVTKAGQATDAATATTPHAVGGESAPRADAPSSGTIDHVAFQATRPEEAAEHLRRHGVNFTATSS